jgi:DNA-binding MarR family transcriptional regulator
MPAGRPQLIDGIHQRIAALWNEGNSSGVIAQVLLVDVSYVNNAIQRMRKRGVPLRNSQPTKRARQIGLDFK